MDDLAADPARRRHLLLPPPAPGTADPAALRAELRDLRERRREQMHLHSTKVITAADLAAGMREIDELTAGVQARLAATRRTDPLKDFRDRPADVVWDCPAGRPQARRDPAAGRHRVCARDAGRPEVQRGLGARDLEGVTAWGSPHVAAHGVHPDEEVPHAPASHRDDHPGVQLADRVRLQTVTPSGGAGAGQAAQDVALPGRPGRSARERHRVIAVGRLTSAFLASCAATTASALA